MNCRGEDEVWPTPQASTGTNDLNWEATDVRGRPNKIGWGVRVNQNGQFDYEPPRTVTGCPNRAKRLKCLGNAVVPAQARPFFEAMTQMHNLTTPNVSRETLRTLPVDARIDAGFAQFGNGKMGLKNLK
jgi:hypothetical protein